MFVAQSSEWLLLYSSLFITAAELVTFAVNFSALIQTHYITLHNTVDF